MCRISFIVKGTPLSGSVVVDLNGGHFRGVPLYYPIPPSIFRAFLKNTNCLTPKGKFNLSTANGGEWNCKIPKTGKSFLNGNDE